MITFYGWLGESYIDEGGVMKETNKEFDLQVEGRRYRHWLMENRVILLVLTLTVYDA